MSQCPLKAAKAKLIEKQNLLKKAEEEVKIAEEEYRRQLYLNPMNLVRFAGVVILIVISCEIQDMFLQ